MKTFTCLRMSIPNFPLFSPSSFSLRQNFPKVCCLQNPNLVSEEFKYKKKHTKSGNFAISSVSETSPVLGLEDALMGFIYGERKVTEVAHSVWRHVVRGGDIVIDATCGNGHDTLALLKMVSNGSGHGHVYGLDIQQFALDSTHSLLDEAATLYERGLVKLFLLCHSRMEEIVPEGVSIRLVAFNLGYLPGGDKAVITSPKTTLPALEATTRILQRGGFISVMVYIGHPGGREELETVEGFASGLPAGSWSCSRFTMFNRPASPVLFLIFKKCGFIEMGTSSLPLPLSLPVKG
ncbi:uncharacterized protein LOC18435912 isoform X2 [Amborella trichopoda]|uniref:rRNA methylase YtqB n=1 Tax=Amborella trichopoda TaxID=13333 RepID=W1PI67_AMBTC|nr:uncharacterized protein LOC18435912 isoform X2 [Amborella trichopoda]ERN07683.1 hypothetical protein AMTR_s00155p00066550 [Amborella trichopoda]|eukprot:XP_011624047.2 uncharacterized protein LOC18435912 isoform X2 [Amborella trichopoda]